MEEWEKHLTWSAKNGDRPDSTEANCLIAAAMFPLHTAQVFAMTRSDTIAAAKLLAKNGGPPGELTAWGYACLTQCESKDGFRELKNNQGKVIQWLKTH